MYKFSESVCDENSASYRFRENRDVVQCKASSEWKQQRINRGQGKTGWNVGREISWAVQIATTGVARNLCI